MAERREPSTEQVSSSQCMAASIEFLRYTGLWSSDGNPLYRAYTAAMCFNSLLFPILYAIPLFGQDFGAFDRIRNAAFFLTIVPVVVTEVSVICNRRAYEEAVAGMRGIFSRPRADGGGKIAALVRRIAADERKAVAGYLLVVAVTASLYLLKPAAEMLFLGSDLASAQLPFKMPRLFGRKVAEYAFQCAVTFLFAAVMAAVDAFSLAAVKCAAHQFEAVSMLLEGMGGDESGAPPPEKALRDSVRLHQDALANARKLADLLNPLMFAHYTTSSANVCLVGYQIAVATDTSQVVTIVCHLVMLLARIFLLSYYSSHVIHQSVNVGHASYSCNWFSGSVDFKRMLTVVISRAQRPVVMRTGPFGVLSLEIFATIMQGAYSYYTILKRLTSP